MSYFSNISYMISHLFLMLFMYLFIVSRYSKILTMLICFFSFSALNILDCCKLNIFPDSDLCYVITTIVQILITQSTAIFISQKRNSQVLFVGLSASSYVIGGSVTSSIIQIYTKNNILALTGSFIVHLATLLVLLVKIRSICLKFQKKTYMENFWELCLIPVFFYCSFSFIAFFPHTLYDNPENILGTIFFIITMFVSYIVVLRYMESESKKNLIHWENIFLESYIKGLENQHYLVERAEQNLKILRHDMKHYSKMMDSLLDQKKYDEIRKIVRHINEVIAKNKVTKYCNHLVINSILSNMMDMAASLNIRVSLDAAVPKEIPINEYEFALVVANLFENAVHCVKDFEKEKRWIEVKIHCLADHLLIETKNEYQEEIVLDSITGLPKSRKGGSHGLGMQSVLGFSEKINANLGCYLDNGIFHIVLFAKL